ncbi:MAG TPA: hypothetical protein VF778_13505 [Xanthobacteraceae bacterium]
MADRSREMVCCKCRVRFHDDRDVQRTVGGGWICCRCAFLERAAWHKWFKENRGSHLPQRDPDQLDYDEYIEEMSIGGLRYDEYR